LELSPTFPQVGVPVVDCVTPLPLREIVAGELLALLATETLPLALPEAVGAKVTLSVAVCPGVSVVFALTPLALYPVPLVLTPEIVTFEFPVFVRATFCVPPLPALTLPKLRLVGFAPISFVTATPAPPKEIPSGELGALLVREIEPLELAAAVGEKTALKVLVFPAGIVNGVVKPLRLKPVPVTVAWEIVTLAPPGFDKVKVCELPVPIVTLPKLALVGVTASCGWTPAPFRAMVVGELLALFTTDTLPFTLPVTVGAKVKPNEALCPAARVNGVVIPLPVKPLPITLTWEILRLLAPVFDSVMDCALLLVPIRTLPKLSEVVLEES
jgi:hypothetical protein